MGFNRSLTRQIRDRQSIMENQRSQHEQAIDDAQILFNPFRGEVSTDPYSGGEGDDLIESIHETTGMASARDLFNFLHSRIFPANTRWLRLAPDPTSSDPTDPEIIALVNSMDKKLQHLLHVSKFSREVMQCIWDLTLIGNSQMSIEWVPELGAMAYKSIDFSRVWVTSDKHGNPDVIHIMWEKSANSWYRFFDGKPGQWVLNRMEKEENFGTMPVQYLQVIQRNENFIPGGIRTNNKKKWQTFWLVWEDTSDKDEEVIVEQGGTDVPLFVIGRSQRVRSEEYGRGLAHIYRSDAAGLNSGYEQLLNALSLHLDPPMMAEHESQVRGDMGPGGFITFMKPEFAVPAPYSANVDLNAVAVLFEAQRAQIKDGFLADVIREPDTQTRSAQAELQKAARSAVRFATLVTDIDDEIMTPALQTTLRLGHRAGFFPELDEIRDRTGRGTVLPVYQSPLFASQRMAAAQNAIEYVGVLGEISNLLRDSDPEGAQLLADMVNKRKFAKFLAEHHISSQEFIRSDQEIELRNAARAEEQVALQQAEQLAQIQRQTRTSLRPGLEVLQQ